MHSKSVIIIANELNHPMPLFAQNCENHFTGLKEFIYQSGVNLSKPNLTNQEMCFELGEQGFIVMLHDKTEITNNLLIFIPKEISPKQYNWFDKRKNGLNDYELMLINNTCDKKWENIDYTITDKPIISELFRILNEKLIPEEKVKIKSKNL